MIQNLTILLLVILHFIFLFKQKKLSKIFFIKHFIIILSFMLILQAWTIQYSFKIFFIVFGIVYLSSLLFFFISYHLKRMNLEPYLLLIIPLLWIFMIFILNKINYAGFIFETLNLSLYKLNAFNIFNNIIFLVIVLEITLVISQLYILFIEKNRLDKKHKYYLIILSILLILILLPYEHNDYSKTLDNKYLLVQGNFNQDWVWRNENSELIFQEYFNLSMLAENSSIIIWPEHSMPLDINKTNYSERLKALSINKNSTIIIGHVRDSKSLYHYDSATIFSQGKVIGTYDSIAPVFFNEKTLPGENPFIFRVNGIDYGIIICYEELNDNIFRIYKSLGVDVLISLVNEQEIQGSIGQGLAEEFIMMRAKQYGVYVIRATNTGKTEIISPEGKILSSIPTNTRSVLYYGT